MHISLVEQASSLSNTGKASSDAQPSDACGTDD